MKFLCPACDRLMEIAVFRVEGAALVLRCGKCGVESRTEEAREARPAAPAEAPRVAQAEPVEAHRAERVESTEAPRVAQEEPVEAHRAVPEEELAETLRAVPEELAEAIRALSEEPAEAPRAVPEAPVGAPRIALVEPVEVPRAVPEKPAEAPRVALVEPVEVPRAEPEAPAEAPRVALVKPVEVPRAEPAEALRAAAEPEVPSAKVVPLRPVVAMAVRSLAEAVPREEDWLTVPEGRCPKCVAPRRTGVVACGQCGLVFANFRPQEHQPSVLLLASWRELTRSWTEPGAHERFVKDAMVRQDLVAAGRLYRIRLAHAPEDEMANHGRDLMMKTAANAPLAPEGDKGSPAAAARVAKAVAVGLLLLMVGGLLLVMVRHLTGEGGP